MSDADQAMLLAEMQISFEFYGQEISAPARFVQNLKNNPHIVIQLSEFPWSYELFSDISLPSAERRALIAPLLSEGPSEIQLETGTVVEVVPISLIFGQQEFELHFRERPCVVLDLNDPIHEVRFEVMNFTGDVLNRPVTLSTACWNLELTPVQHRSKLVEKLDDSAGFGITHEAMFTRNDCRCFQVDEVQSLLNAVDTFLSFLCGSACATTNVAGMDAKGNTVWRRWGPRHVSDWKRERSWSDITTSHEISGLFPGFIEIYLKNPEHVGRIVRLYISSNENDSVDMSIIMNQIAFEVVMTILMDTERRSKGKPGNRIAEMLSSLEIENVVPDYFDALLTLAEKRGWAHGPHALIKIRNSLVHADNKLGLISIDAYFEAKQLGLWYLELLLLHSFGYEGEYASRLKPVQKAGETELVPWAKEN